MGKILKYNEFQLNEGKFKNYVAGAAIAASTLFNPHSVEARDKGDKTEVSKNKGSVRYVDLDLQHVNIVNKPNKLGQYEINNTTVNDVSGIGEVRPLGENTKILSLPKESLTIKGVTFKSVELYFVDDVLVKILAEYEGADAVQFRNHFVNKYFIGKIGGLGGNTSNAANPLIRNEKMVMNPCTMITMGVYYDINLDGNHITLTIYDRKKSKDIR